MPEKVLPIDIKGVLKRAEIFKDIEASHLASLEADMEWAYYRGGEFVVQQGDAPQALYIVANGSLKATVWDKQQQVVFARNVNPFDCIGEVALLTDSPHMGAVQALRDSLLVRINKDSFEKLLQASPHFQRHLAKSIGRRLQDAVGPERHEGKKTLSTIAVVPGHKGLPVENFVEDLIKELEGHGTVLFLDREKVESHLGGAEVPQSKDTPEAHRLVQWLNDLETQYRFVVYVADSTPSPWTTCSLRQADHILFLASLEEGARPIELSEHPVFDMQLNILGKRDWVFIHPEGKRLLHGIQHCLEALPLNDHHHYSMGDRSDIARLTRLLLGKGIGLVLGAGGVRGFAHIGLLRAFEESGIPIDRVGGVSMGAVVAAQVALGWDPESMRVRTKEAFKDMTQSLDYTMPIVSIVSGGKATAVLDRLFSEAEVEDLWLRFFALSTNLNTGDRVIHRKGSLWKCLRASSSIPGLAPPFYHDGELLIDGGIINPIPADIMRDETGIGSVIAVDVSSEVNLKRAPDMGSSVSGWKVLWNYINPMEESIEVPTIFDVLLRVTELNGARMRSEITERGLAEVFIRPPVEEYGLLQLAAFDEIVEVGYKHGLKHIEEWKEQLNL